MKPGEAFCFSWVLGYLWAVTCYALCIRFHMAGIFLPGMIGLNGFYWFFYFRKDLENWRKPYSLGLQQLPYAVCLVLLVAFPWMAVGAWSHFGAEGLKLTGVLHSDTLLGSAVAAMSKIAVPPENPMLGGEKFVYHYFPYLALTLFSKYFSFPILSLTFVYVQILAQCLFFMTVLCAASRLFPDARMRFAAVFLTVFVGHLEFKIGYAMGSAYYFWGLCFFSEYLKNPNRTALILCCLLWGAAVSSLTVLSLMILPSLFLFILLYTVQKSPSTLSLLCLSAGLLIATVLWYLLSYEPGTGMQGNGPLVKLGFPLAHRAQEYLKLFSPDFPEFLARLQAEMPDDFKNLFFRKINLLRLLFFYGVQGLSFLVLSAAFLDLALAGFVSALRSFWKKDFLSAPALSFAGWTGAVGVLSSWFLQWREPDITYAYYMMSYGLLLFYSVTPLFKFFSRPGRWVSKILVLGVIAYIVCYKTIGKITGFRASNGYTLLSPELLDAYAFIKKEIPPSDLILHPLVHEKIYFPDGSVKNWEHHHYFFPILTEKRSFFIRPNNRDDFAPNELPVSDEKRRRDWEKFFETGKSQEAFGILDRYSLRWVVSTRENPLHFSPGDRLKPVYQNASVTVFRYGIPRYPATG